MTALDTFRSNLPLEALEGAIDLFDIVERHREELDEEERLAKLDPHEIMLGHQQLELEVPPAPTDIELLDALHDLHPAGLYIVCDSGNVPPVLILPRLLKQICSVDSFGLELNGFGHIACELLRLACDKQRAEDFGSYEIERLMKSFIRACQQRAVSKSTNQLHAYRWGITSKVVCSDGVPPNTMEVAPGGNVTKRLLKAAELENEDDLWGTYFLVLRHPFILSYVVQVWPNKHLTKNLTMVNRLDFRKVTHGDADGDGGNYFPLPDEATALDIRDELAQAVPEHDGSLLIRGLASHDPEMGMWGENIYADGKTTEAKFDQEFTKNRSEWLESHATMADYANRLTPFSYRISDVAANMAAAGWPRARTVSLMGAIIEEDFYIGLTGGPKLLDKAMEAWYQSNGRSKTARRAISDGLRTVVPDHVLEQDVMLCLLHAARINAGEVNSTPFDLIPYFTWMAGKGRTSTAKAQELYADLIAIGDEGLPESLENNLLARIAVFAARMLQPFAGEMTNLDDSEDEEAY